MNSNFMSQMAKRGVRVVAVCLFVFFLFAAFTSVTEATSPPTVDGRFYGDGDYDRYGLYSVSDRGSRLYYRLDEGTLYVALVTSTVNDNVFGDEDYMATAGYRVPFREARRLFDSEFMGFSLAACGQTWDWQQAYGRQPGLQPIDHTNTDATWVSDHLVGAGSGTPPPGYVSSSSLVWNMNTYANSQPTPAFDMDVLGAGPNFWNSPYDGAAPVSVPADYTTGFSTTYQWEWPMVYEWSADLSDPGCAGSTVAINSSVSHHSPPKDNDVTPDPNDPIPEPEAGNILTDWGDLPALYPTTFAQDGARHLVVLDGAYLGSVAPDAEPDGNPSPTASGDDTQIAAVNDEDGVILLEGLTWSGIVFTGSIQVIAGTDGCLSAFIDLNGDGELSPVYLDGVVLSDYCIAAGTYVWEITVLGTDEPGAAGPTVARFRFTNEPDQGGASPTGQATTGEVEDYLWAIPTAITLRNVTTDGQTIGLVATLIVALGGLGLTSLFVLSRRKRTA